MLNTADREELDRFLRSRHDPVCRHLLPDGASLGSWRVVSFLGHGGFGEVYRVVHAATGTEAAAKVLLRDDPSARRRFDEEAGFLKGNSLPQFPRFYESGVCDDRVFVAMELLEPVECPDDDGGVAEYLLGVCECVAALHRSGRVHRDLKPKNIMRRQSGAMVLIDFGLVKDVLESPMPRKDISMVSGRMVGIGTPEYAAPEQLLGGGVSAATDIHALGRMANAAFDGHPPRCWLEIIRRSTSSIPAQRYGSVDDLAAAIRNRHRSRFWMMGCAFMIGAGMVLWSFSLYWRKAGREDYAWHALGENVVTNIVENKLLWTKYGTNKLGRSFCSEQAFGIVTNELAVTLIRLGGEKHVFQRPLFLRDDHEYWVEGPGVLDAAVVSAGTNTTIRLRNCSFTNRSAIPIDKAGIRYVSQGHVRLSFTSQDPMEPVPRRKYFVDFDGMFDDISINRDGNDEAKTGEWAW